MKVLFLLLFSSLNSVRSITINDARLTGGYQGTVKVLTQRGWLPVCSSSWSRYSESRVLCRQLGYNPNYTPRTSKSSSSNTSLEFYFGCSRADSEISKCYYNFYNERSSCSHIVSVTCSPCSPGSVRLHGGIVPEAGTVEYCVSGSWKAVCSSRWDYKDAFVVCRQLGYPATDAIVYNSYFGNDQVTHTIRFNCFGNESLISNCQTSSTSCNFINTAGVYCTGEVIEDFCINGHIRLAGGNNTNEGRVEMCSNGVWGTIYNGGWDSRDAKVVCKQLGLYQPYSRVEVFRSTYFGRGTGPILYAYLNCDGTETTLADCTYSSAPFYVSHSSDAGVRCTRNTVNTRSDCNNGDVHLVNGTTSSEGRVEICYDGVWGSVCDSGWDYWDAAIVCLQLGFQGANATALTNSYFSDGTGPYHLSNVGCSGEERTLLQCSYGYSTIGYHTCPSGREAGVRCDASTCTHGEVRLFGGYTDHDGVAEVCINGFWADICQDVSDKVTLSRTFCRQFMGEGSSYSYSSCCARQRNTGNITLYSVSCSGSSGQFIQDCSYQIVSGYSTAGCNLQEELVVGCYESSNCTSGDIRLRGGNSTREGRVEFCSQGLWGSIAVDRYRRYRTDSGIAMVVCRQLGLAWEWSLAVRNGLFGRSSTRNVAIVYYCSGTEQRLSDCSFNSITRTSGLWYEVYYPFGVICQGNTSAPTECEHGAVRLTDGKKPTQGRVEICARGYWATTCNSLWNNVATEIVCRQLGLPVSGLEYVSDNRFGANYQFPIVSVYCSSVRSANISECSIRTQLRYSNCNHKNTIGIYCQDYTEQGYYNITVDVIPVQQSYEIGSQVKLNCTLDPTSIHNGDVVSYRWTSSQRGGTISFSRTATLSIQTYYLDSVGYHCQVFRNHRLLGTQATTLNTKGLLLSSNNTNIQARERGTVQLQTVPLKIAVVNSLLNLTWYHNGSIMAPNYSPRHTFSNRNKTMTITNFTSTDAGIYQAQFNQLFVHPFNEDCKEKVLSLLRNHPVLKPAVFCVNMLGSCSDIVLPPREREISIQSIYSSLEGSLNNFTLMASGTLLNNKELQHASIWWYRNGQRVTSDLLTLKKNYNSLSIRQNLQVVDGDYEHSGRYEVLLKIDMFTYLRDSSCQPYYDRFVVQYLTRYMTLAQGYANVYYYRDLKLSLVVGKEATSMDDGTDLTCRASIHFPPFSILLLIKNGQTVATSTSGLLRINTKSVNTNPFGLYICQLNASGAIFQRSNAIKERAKLRMTIDVGDSNTCSGVDKSAIDVALTLKISTECGCNFTRADLHDSVTDCKDNGELVYSTNLEYSNDEGSETASVIANRLQYQAPFSMTVQGMPVTVTTVCTECTTGATLSQAAGGGLFVGGFVLATLLIGIIALVIIVLLIKRRGTNSVDGGTMVKGDPLRYTTAAQKNPPTKKKVELSEQTDYEVMDPAGQAIYEETF